MIGQFSFNAVIFIKVFYENVIYCLIVYVWIDKIIVIKLNDYILKAGSYSEINSSALNFFTTMTIDNILPMSRTLIRLT